MTVMHYDGPAWGLMLGLVVVGWVGLVIAGISAIASMWAAKKQADAAKEAAKIQVEGTKSAQGYIDKGYAEGKAAFQPWLTTGGAAASTLGTLMGLGGGNGGTTTAPAPTYPLADLWYARDRGDRPATGRAVPRDPTATPESIIAGATDPRRPSPLTMPGSVQSDAQARTQSSYVRMQAPDGSVEAVPSQYVDHYRQRGASVVA